MRRDIGVGAVAAVCLAVLLGPGLAAGAETPDKPAPVVDLQDGGGIGPNGEYPAEHSPLESPERMAWQGQFQEIVDQLRLEYADDFGIPMVNEDGVSGSIEFEGSAPPGALKVLASLDKIEVIQNSGYSEKDVLEASERLHQQAAAMVTGNVESSESGFDLVNRYFEMSYVLTDGEQARTSERADVAARLADSVQPPAGLQIKVNSDPADELVPQDLRGGHVTYRNGDLLCTASFPVKKNGSSEIGVLTAGHCSGASTQWVPNGGMYFQVLPGSQATTDVYPGGDFRWLWSNTMFDGYTWGGADYRKFNGSTLATGGMSICKYGATTGYGCSTVAEFGEGTTSTVLPEDGGGTYNVYPLTCTANAITAGGDSGGPWYARQIAYGIHTAGNSVKSCYSQVNLATARFGVTLWVG